jgi:hypothetical protein
MFSAALHISTVRRLETNSAMVLEGYWALGLAPTDRPGVYETYHHQEGDAIILQDLRRDLAIRVENVLI